MVLLREQAIGAEQIWPDDCTGCQFGLRLRAITTGCVVAYVSTGQPYESFFEKSVSSIKVESIFSTSFPLASDFSFTLIHAGSA